MIESGKRVEAMTEVRSRLSIIAAAMIVIVASPAVAQSARKAKAQRPSPATSHNVFAGQRYLGTDPDPNVRFEIMRQQNWRKGG
jgi:hypothetical protein